jgi:hypothetical protein
MALICGWHSSSAGFAGCEVRAPVRAASRQDQSRQAHVTSVQGARPGRSSGRTNCQTSRVGAGHPVAARSAQRSAQPGGRSPGPVRPANQVGSELRAERRFSGVGRPTAVADVRSFHAGEVRPARGGAQCQLESEPLPGAWPTVISALIHFVRPCRLQT